MTKKQLNQLGELQKQIMEIVWENKNISAREVQTELESLNSRRYAYTSILYTMQKLESYGWLKHTVHGRSNIYSPTKSRSKAAMNSVKKLIDSVFHGNTHLLFQHMVDHDEFSEEDLKAIQALVKRKLKKIQ